MLFSNHIQFLRTRRRQQHAFCMIKIICWALLNHLNSPEKIGNIYYFPEVLSQLDWLSFRGGRYKRDQRFLTVNLSQWAHPAPSRFAYACFGQRQITQSLCESSGVRKHLHGGTQWQKLLDLTFCCPCLQNKWLLNNLFFLRNGSFADVIGPLEWMECLECWLLV